VARPATKKVSKKKSAKKKSGKKKSAKKKSAKKKSGKKTSRSVPAVLVTGTPADPALRLTAEILELDRTGKRANVHRLREIGQRLLALQRHLGFGDWLKWLVDRLPYSPRTAQAYISLAVWADEFEDDFEAFAHLGIAKLQLLAALPASRRARFRNGGTFAIPGSGSARGWR
jgi:hypothetical protein